MITVYKIEKIPEEVRDLVAFGLGSAIQKGSLGGVKVDTVQIEVSLSGGKTGAVVFVARYGVLKEDFHSTSSFIRVLKIAPKTVCQIDL